MGGESIPTVAFRFTGTEQTWTVPSDVHRVVLGAVGGGAAVNGLYLAVGFLAWVTVTPGEVWKIKVGGPPSYSYDPDLGVATMGTAGGWPNGGAGAGGYDGSDFAPGSMGGTGGGGSTTIRRDGQTDPFAVAPGTGGRPGLARLREYDLDGGLVAEGSYNVDLDTLVQSEFVRYAGQARPGAGAGQRAPRAAPDPTYPPDPLRVFSQSLGNAGGADAGGAGILVDGYGTGGGGGGWGGGASGPYYHAAGGIYTGTDGLGHPIEELGDPGEHVANYSLDYEGNGRTGGMLLPVPSSAVLGTDWTLATGENALGVYTPDESHEVGPDHTSTRIADGAVLIQWEPVGGSGWNVGHIGG